MKKKNSRKIAIFQKMKNCNFPRVFHFFFIFFHFFFMFFSFFIIFASSGAKIFKKIKKCNFPRVFSFFFHFFIICLSFFIIFHHFLSFFINSTTGSKNDKKMIKNEKNSRKIAIFQFLDFFLHHWKKK